ncbi:MAG: hypothetical protein P8Y47_13585 [Alphaproteobacteria bacterium]
MIKLPEIYRLSVAAKMFFPGGGITANSLRAEARAGRLEIIRIANKDFVTKDALLKMMENCACRENQLRPASASDTRKGAPRSGQSSTAHAELALAAVRMTLQELSKPSKDTSPKNTSRAAKVEQIGS